MRSFLCGVAIVAAVSVPSGSAAAEPPPTLKEACLSTSGLAAQSRWLTTSDGVRLYAVTAGRGSTVIVLAHEGGSTLCGSLTYAATLVRAGFRVLAFDFRDYGLSGRSGKHGLLLGNDLAAAVAHARAGGARRVFLTGASMGGAAVVQNTASLRVDGRISLSGTRLWQGYGINAPGSLARIRAPFLYLGSRDDSRAPLAEARGIVKRIGARDKRAVFYAGSFHGWSLVDGAPFAARARGLVLTWIRSHS
jgi:alpha-beta hydrolase superfamily lysophospholipase